MSDAREVVVRHLDGLRVGRSALVEAGELAMAEMAKIRIETLEAVLADVDADTYTCAACGGTFEKGRSDQEAAKELGELFPDVSEGECDLVCDDCWVAMGSGRTPNPTPEQREAFRRYLATKVRAMTVVPEEIRNVGESYGLEYPYVCRSVWMVWHRETGEIVHFEWNDHPILDEALCRERCRQLNGLGDETPEEVAAINSLHDAEE